MTHLKAPPPRFPGLLGVGCLSLFLIQMGSLSETKAWYTTAAHSWPGDWPYAQKLPLQPLPLSSRKGNETKRRTGTAPASRPCHQRGPATPSSVLGFPQDRSVNSGPLVSRAGYNLSGILLLPNSVPKTILGLIY